MPDADAPLRFMRTLWRLVHGLDVRSKWMKRNLGVTGPQRLVLRIIGRQPQINASAIAAALEMHPSTLTGILSRLEERGHITRTRDPSDRRRAHFSLTPHGVAIDRVQKGTVEAAVRRMLERTAPRDVERTRELLDALAVELEQTAPAARARK